ncbi:MAG: hypothetical protein Q7S10_00785 [bacterium]|nr:hypothetical protein [bacterium]
MTWEEFYNLLGIADFIAFTSSPELQASLLPIKIVFILFTAFFLLAVIYFYTNSSYLQYQFLQDTEEFFSWQPYGLRAINKRWAKLMKKIQTGDEDEYKLAVIDADDFLYQALEEQGYKGETFEELANNAGSRILPNLDEILAAHQLRNSIVYTPEYKLEAEQAKNLLSLYEVAIKNVVTA